MNKIVKVCNIHGELTEEKVRRRKPPRKEIICKLCDSERQKLRRQNNPEKFKKHRDKYRYIERAADIKELKCSRCQNIFSIESFSPYMLKIRYPYCQTCHSESQKKSKNKEIHKLRDKEWRKKYHPIAENNRLLKKYNISLEDYNAMLEKQNYGCAICGDTEEKLSRSGVATIRLCVDHNHETGTLRGLLCFRCNIGIGFLKDDQYRIVRALEYLDIHLDK